MTESDALARAARALREAHTGEREGSGFTRARIMNSVHRERRRRTLRWAICSPLASVLLVGSAWAQSTGKWPVLWKAVTSVFVEARAPSPAPTGPSPSSRSQRHPETSLPRDEPVPTSPELAGDAGGEAPSLAPPPEQEGDPRLGAGPVEPERRARKPLRRRGRPAPDGARSPERAPGARAPETPAEPERDRELGSFRRAHDLHFSGRASDAVAAYTEYLREYPQGRFVPEARYALALDQIKLGDEAAAREALAPFAAGRYGGYRQKEARALLQALDEKQKPASR
jgi:hypothetical protein